MVKQVDKLRLATVFSGIGAIEQALKRLQVDFSVEFACDNGDVPLEGIDSDTELAKIKKMGSVREKRDYVRGLYHEHSRKHNFVEDAYRANYGSELVDDNFFYDVTMLDGTDFRDNVDLFVGGSPCQSFSIAGARGGFRDTRGTLFYQYCRLVQEIQPRVFIYENVYGVLNHDGGRTWDTMRNSFHELGYHIVEPQILDARNYGIPQGRRRLFVVGFRDEKLCSAFRYPDPAPLDTEKINMQSFLLDNCPFGSFTYYREDGEGHRKGDLCIEKGHQDPDPKLFLSDKLVKYILSPGTKNFYHPNDTVTDLPVARAILSTQGNTHRASVNNYVSYPDDNPENRWGRKYRALDPRESLRLMGFPDDFITEDPVTGFRLSKAQSYRQSGNSIVVDVFIALLRNLLPLTGYHDKEKMNLNSNRNDRMLEEHGAVVYDRIIPAEKRYRTVSLFSGIGGFDLGFSYAGFDVVWANDIEKYACETYRANVSGNIVCGDIRIEKENIPEHDVLIGGFPCQPFSTLGKLEGFDDSSGRGTLFFQITDIIRKHKTKVVVLENVKNIMNHDGGRTFRRIVDELEALGYKVYHHIFNSLNYGVPQRRNRCYIVALRSDAFDNLPETNEEFPFPEKLYEDGDTRLSTLKMLDEDVDASYFLTKKIEKTIMGTGTKNYVAAPTIDLPVSKTLTATMHKMHRASQDNYVTDNRNFERCSPE